MIEIEDFGPKLLRGRDALLLGDKKRKNASFRSLMEAWPQMYPDDALIVLDYPGGFYERFEGEPILADLASEGSVVPDVIEPFLLSESVGDMSRNIANAIRQAVYQEIKSRDANDKFFDDLGKLVTDRMLVYMLETEKNVVCNIAGASQKNAGQKILGTIARLNLFSIFCRQHGYIESLMTKAISGESGSLPTKNDLKNAKAQGRPLTRGYALSKYILDNELRFQKDGGRDSPVPFADLLFTTSEHSNTQRCIKMQADASTADFRALVALINDKSALLSGLATLKLGEYMRSQRGTPLFVCSSGSVQADRGLAPLLVSAAGAAAQAAGRKVVVFIPELDRWGLVNYLEKFRQYWDGVNFIFGYENFSRLLLDSRAEEDRLIETLYSQSGIRVWHATKEERLNKAFSSYVSEADVIYRPDDLDEEIRAIEEDGNIRYAALCEKADTGRLRRRVKLQRERGGARLWIMESSSKTEKLTLRSLMEKGDDVFDC